jgi:hypothetical protein
MTLRKSWPLVALAVFSGLTPTLLGGLAIGAVGGGAIAWYFTKPALGVESARDSIRVPPHGHELLVAGFGLKGTIGAVVGSHVLSR